MGYKKGILGAASVLALIAGTQGSASASTNIAGETAGNGAPQGVVTAGQASEDPLFHFIKLTNNGESVADAAQGMFGDASQAQIEQLPQLMHGVSTLGWRAADVEQLKDALIQIVQSSSNVDDNTRQTITADLQNQDPIRLADNNDNNNNNDDNNRDPQTTGSIGGGGGGGGFVGHGGVGGMYGH